MFDEEVAGGDGGDEAAVVGDEDAGCGLVEDFGFELFLPGDVDVVGGFVEEIEVGLDEAEGEEAEAGFLAGRKERDGFALGVDTEAGAGEETGGALVAHGVPGGDEAVGGLGVGEVGHELVGVTGDGGRGDADAGGFSGGGLQEEADEAGLADAVAALDDEAVALVDVEFGNVEQELAAGGVDGEVAEGDEDLGVGAAAGEADVGGAFGVGGAEGLFQAFGAFFQLLGLLLQEVAPAVDADVLEFAGVAAEAADFLGVLGVLAVLRGVVVGEEFSGAGVGVGVEAADGGAEEEGSGGAGVEEAAVVAGDEHGGVGGGALEPGLEHGDLLGVEMVGGFVEEEGVGLGDPDAGEEHEALPAAAQGADGAVMEGFRGVELVEDHADAPGFVLAGSRREGAADGFLEGEVEEGFGDVLFDETGAETAGAGDVAGGGFGLVGDAAEEGGLAAAIAGDEADAVTLADGEGEVLEEGTWRDNADVAEVYCRHANWNRSSAAGGPGTTRAGLTLERLSSVGAALRRLIAGRCRGHGGDADCMLACSPPWAGGSMGWL